MHLLTFKSPGSQRFLLPILKEAVLPLRLLRYGRFSLVAYSLIFSIIAIYLANQATQYLSSFFLSYIQEAHSQKNVSIAKWLMIASIFLCWIATFPVYLFAFVLPVRDVWINKHLRFFKLLTEAPRAFALATRTSWLALRAAIPLLAPAIAISIIFPFLKDRLDESGRIVSFLGCLFLALFSLYKALPILLSPLVALAGGYGPEQSVYNSVRVLAPKRKVGLVAILIGAIPPLLIWKLAPYVTSNVSLQSILYRCILILSAWYVISFLTIKTLDAIADVLLIERQANTPQQPPQPPPGPTPPPQQPQAIPADFRVTQVKIEK